MNLKQKFGGTILAATLGLALIGGGSYALFTSQTSSTDNTFTSGGVTIENFGSTFSSIDYFGNLAPGDADDWTVTIKNTNTLDAWVKVKGDYEATGDLFTGATPLVVDKNTQVILIPAGETRDFTFHYEFPINAGNEYQGKTGNLKINFQAVQVRNNSDDNGPLSWNTDPNVN